MKRISFLLFALLMAGTTCFAQQFSVDGKVAKFNAPEGITEDEEILFPTFDYLNEPTLADDTVKFNVTQCLTYVKTDTLTGDPVISATIASYITPGCRLTMQVYNDTCTFSTGFTAPSLPVPTGKIKMIEFIYDGTVFRPIGTAIQLN